MSITVNYYNLIFSLLLSFAEKTTPAKVAEQHQQQQPLKPLVVGQVPPIVVGPVAVGPVVVVGATPPGGPPQGPPIPVAGGPGIPYGMYPFYAQSPYMMGQQLDPLTGKPMAGPPGATVQSMGVPVMAGGPGVPPQQLQQQQPLQQQPPPVNLCDYSKGGAKEPPPLDLMTKQQQPPVDLNPGPVPPSSVVQQQHQPQQHQQQQQPLHLGQGPLSSVGPHSGEPTSPMKEYPGAMSAATALAVAQQQHQQHQQHQQQQQAKVLSHYYPYK